MHIVTAHERNKNILARTQMCEGDMQEGPPQVRAGVGLGWMLEMQRADHRSREKRSGAIDRDRRRHLG